MTTTLAPTPTARLLYDRKSAASMLSISVRALDYLIARQTVGVRRIGSRVLIPAAELLRVAGEDHHFTVAG